MPIDFFPLATGSPFPATAHTGLLALTRDDDRERTRAFDRLVRAYLRPVYTHLRLAWKKDPARAEDLTQGFFARAFEKRYFADYDPRRARFRTYMRHCVDRYVSESDRDARRLKRGGAASHLSLDLAFDEAERVVGGVAASPEEAFDTEWRRGLLASALEALRERCEREGKENHYRAFRRIATSDGDDRPSYADVASELGITISDVTNYLYWSKRALRSIVLASLCELTASEEEFREEARALGISP